MSVTLTQPYWQPDVGLPASKTVSSEGVVSNLPSCGILLRQPEWTKMGGHSGKCMGLEPGIPGLESWLCHFQVIKHGEVDEPL